MTRFALALTAVLLLVLSASFTHVQLQQAVAQPRAIAGAARGQGRLMTADSSLLLDSSAVRQVAPLLGATPADDGPAPALLVYLVLVLVGSIAAVAFVRRSQGREL